MSVTYSFRWVLPDANVDSVIGIVEKYRQYALKMGAESVGELVVLTKDEANLVSTGASVVVMFKAVLPTVRSATGGIPQYGLASSDGTSWEWSGVLRVDGFHEISELIHAATELGGVNTYQTFAGMVMLGKKHNGIVVYDQHYALQDGCNRRSAGVGWELAKSG